MWVITHKGKPVTFSQIADIERKLVNHWMDVEGQEELYIVARTKRSAINTFLHYAGFTWKEHVETGYDVKRIDR